MWWGRDFVLFSFENQVFHHQQYHLIKNYADKNVVRLCDIVKKTKFTDRQFEKMCLLKKNCSQIYGNFNILRCFHSVYFAIYNRPTHIYTINQSLMNKSCNIQIDQTIFSLYYLSYIYIYYLFIMILVAPNKKTKVMQFCRILDL